MRTRICRAAQRLHAHVDRRYPAADGRSRLAHARCRSGGCGDGLRGQMQPGNGTPIRSRARLIYEYGNDLLNVAELSGVEATPTDPI